MVTHICPDCNELCLVATCMVCGGPTVSADYSLHHLEDVGGPPVTGPPRPVDFDEPTELDFE